jgi:4-hydroxybenzoate polyprenyltransferase
MEPRVRDSKDEESVRIALDALPCRADVQAGNAPRVNRLRVVVTALRMRDWVKNILVLMPALVAGRVTEPSVLLRLGSALLAFSLAASSAYVLNDILDRQADRQHPAKHHRPLASGAMAIATGVLLIPLLLLLAVAVAWPLLPRPFIAVLGAYVALSAVYSVWIKRVIVADVALLAGLYTVRILGGAIASAIPISPWLLACSFAGFASLASLKRYAEIQIWAARLGLRLPGRPYTSRHRGLLQGLGFVSGALCILIFIANGSSDWLPWIRSASGACLAYWMVRSWSLARRGRMGIDPLTFAVHDPDTYAVGAVVAVGLIGRG